MRLKLDELQNVVRKTIDEENLAKSLKTEIGKVLGTVVITEGKLENVVASANDRLDVLDRTGRSNRLAFSSSVVANFLEHSNPEVRKFVARVCAENHLPRMMNDRNSNVRAAVAARLQLPAVREMMKRFPQDDQIRTIFRAKKKLHEAGIATPEIKPIATDPVAGKERLGDTVKQSEGPELSDNWYHQLALRFLHDYGGNIEYAWEDITVRRYCSSVKATSGVEVDSEKLLKQIKDLITDREDVAMERNALKETLAWLESSEDLNESTLHECSSPDLNDQTDEVYDLVNGNLTGRQFINKAMNLFQIKETMLSDNIRTHRLNEGSAKQTIVPNEATLQHHTFRSVDERAFDIFCEHWSKYQQLLGEPLRLQWNNDPTDASKVTFTCTLK